MVRLGIYGYECTREAVFDMYRMVPLSNTHQEVEALASDRNAYNLTAFLEVNSESANYLRQLIFDLEGVLSFIDQKDVLIANRLRDSEDYGQLAEDYPKSISGHFRHSGGGKVVMSDAFSSDSRRTFIELAMAKLTDTTDTNNATFRGAFYKSIEVFRARQRFIDVSFYLLFSALESLSRAALSDTSPNCAKPIGQLLRTYGFDIYENSVRDLRKSVSTYARLRNALFHNGKHEAETNVNGTTITLALSDYLSPFERLVPLVMMKYIGFDDGRTNWNSWLDRMMFKS